MANSYSVCSIYSFKVNSFKILDITLKFPKNYCIFNEDFIILETIQTILRTLYCNESIN